MSANIPGKLNIKRTILIGLAFLTSQAAWAYFNFIMPLMLREFYTDMNINWIGADTFVGMVMVLDNIVAVICLPFFGIISDHTHSKYGFRPGGDILVKWSKHGTVTGRRIRDVTQHRSCISKNQRRGRPHHAAQPVTNCNSWFYCISFICSIIFYG